MNKKLSIKPNDCKQTSRPAGEMTNRSTTLLVIPSTLQGVLFFIFLVGIESRIIGKIDSYGYTLENVYCLFMGIGLINYLSSELKNFIKIIKKHFDNKKIKQENKIIIEIEKELFLKHNYKSSDIKRLLEKNKLSVLRKIIKINLDKKTKL